MSKRRVASMFCLIILTITNILCGCGKEETSGADSYVQTGSYIESDLTLPEEMGFTNNYALKKMNDGTIGLLSTENGIYTSADGGATWTKGVSDFTSKTVDNPAVAALGADGSAFIVYMSDTIVNDMYQNECVYIDAEGNCDYEPFDTSVVNKAIDYRGLTIRDDGKIYTSKDSAIWCLDPVTRQATQVCETDFEAYDIAFCGDMLIAIGRAELQIYDLKEEQFVEDSILDDFIAEHGFLSNYYVGNTVNMDIQPGDEENSIYIATNKGIYYHIIGGNLIEEVMKGESSYLANIEMHIGDFLYAGNKEMYLFYLKGEIFFTGMLAKYTYDENVVITIDKTLKIYSLYESDTIRLAISCFQKAYPNVAVSYEVGITDVNAMTTDDAVRNLNTALLSGNAPDVIILDNLPIQSYISKGMLVDLSDYMSESFTEDDYYTNIVNAFKQGNTLCCIPTRYSFDILAGDKEVLDQITDVDSLLAQTVKLRDNGADKYILGGLTETNILDLIYTNSSAALVNEDGTLKEENLTAFIQLAKGLWENESKTSSTDMRLYFNDDETNGKLDLSTRLFCAMAGETELVVGKCDEVAYEYDFLTSYINSSEYSNNGIWKLMPGMSENSFKPEIVAGICATSKNQEEAWDFIELLLGNDVQTNSSCKGLPVIKACFDTMCISINYEEGCYNSVGDSSGQMHQLTVEWPSEDEIQQLKDAILSLQNPECTDRVIYETIYEIAPKAMNGEITVEDAVSQIISTIQLYLSE